MSIYQKILAVMKDVQYLAKDDTVQFNATKYKAITEEKVTTAVRDSMVRNGLVIIPTSVIWSRNGNITHVDTTYDLVDAETGEKASVASSGDGYDTQDKGSGKALTYAFKYALLRTFAIPTGEDPDKISSAQIDAEIESLWTCAECGNPITDSVKTNGEPYTKEQCAMASVRRFKKRLCVDCLRKAIKNSEVDLNA